MTTINLNGRTVSVRSPDDVPLLWVLRDELGLKGTKFGCGIGMCGACTVHVGGRATRSCVTAVGAVAGAEVTTIEGLHPEVSARGSISQPPRVRGCGHRQNGWYIRHQLQERRCCQFDSANRYSPVGHIWRIGQCARSQPCQTSAEHLFWRGGSFVDAVCHCMGSPH
jgi:hypothetical protein